MIEENDKERPRTNSTEKKRTKKKENVVELMTRVIVRQLPPTLSEEQFLEDVSPLPDYKEFYYLNGDLSLREFAFSRAYFKFQSFDDMLIFKDKFDGYVFLDFKGNEFPAIVEYAPLQKMPRRCRDLTQTKQDSKMNTIENDPDFLAFNEELVKSGNISPPPYSADLLLGEIESRLNKENEIKTTPLLEYLNKKHEVKLKNKEERRRKKDIEKKKNDEANKKIREKERKPKEQLVAQQNKKKPSKFSDKNTDNKKPKQDPSYVIKVRVPVDKPKPENSNKPKANEEKNKIKIASEVDQETKVKNDKVQTKTAVKEANSRIRNKDRPAREIYRPGMANKQKQQTENSNQQPSESGASGSGHATNKAKNETGENKSNANPLNSTTQQYKFKHRVFTRTKN